MNPGGAVEDVFPHDMVIHSYRAMGKDSLLVVGFSPR